MYKDLKVLLLTNRIMEYRIDLYNLLAEQFDLTVISLQRDKKQDNYSFNHILYNSYKLAGFHIQLGLFLQCKKFDIVIAMFDISYLTILKLLYSKRNFKMILWGIGAASEKGFDQATSPIKEWMRFVWARKADALILYSDHPVKKYLTMNIAEKKIFVAHNTIHNQYNFRRNLKRNSFLFVGSLGKRKKIQILIKAFANILHQIPTNVNLNIVGDGEMSELVFNMIKSLNLENRVIMHGRLSGKDLLPFFEDAIACISPGQAGLSVLESFSYGVPFITQIDSITGGEKFNIINDHNGYFFETSAELQSLLLKLVTNIDQSLYENSYTFYQNNRSIKHMVEKFKSSIFFVSKYHNNYENID